MALCFLSVRAQQTSLVIDNQTPGWLSSKITYLEQQSVQDLRVTGYVNSTDLQFIGSLMGNALNGKLDLSDVIIIKDENIDDNEIIYNLFDLKKESRLRCIELPKSITKMNTSWGSRLEVDSLILGSPNLPIISQLYLVPSDKSPSVIILREGVEKISPISSASSTDTPERLQTNLETTRSIVLPSTIKSLPRAFLANHTILHSINMPSSIEEIGEYAFVGNTYLPKNLYMPKSLKKFHFNILCNALPDVLYLSENVTSITNKEHYDYNSSGSWYPNLTGDNPVVTSETMEIHIKSKSVPSLSVPSTSYASTVFSNCTIYVPSDLVDSYKERTYFKNATILEEKEITSITFETKDAYYVGDCFQLSPTYYPLDATDKLIEWSTLDPELVTITPDGNVVCNKYGNASIIASTSYGNLTESVNINIYEHTTGVELDQTELEMSVGDVVEIKANVLPLNLSDGRVAWSSSNEDVATVDNDGKVTAYKAGDCTIICTTMDRNYKATCSIKVVQPVSGIELNYSYYKFDGIGKTLLLVATVYPEDASNKTVDWKSSNENVCLVYNGTVVAINSGDAVIIATTVDGGYTAECNISVELDTSIAEIKETGVVYKVFTANGQQLQALQKGLNIIVFEDGTKAKVFVK